MQLLHLKSSILGGNSASSQVSDELVKALKDAGGIDAYQLRDFGSEPVPHLDGEWLGAIATAPEERSPEQQDKAAYSDRLIRELQASDVVVIAAGMYNFSVPSMLKAWIDHVARAGVTFKYTEAGPVGLLPNKTVFVVMASGGFHEAGKSDFVRPYLKQVLGFLGLDEIHFISAEGLNMGKDGREAGIEQARKQIAALTGSAAIRKRARVA